jgi:hypothetical protein
VTNIKVDFCMDDTMVDDRFEVEPGTHVRWKIHPDGRGYLKVPSLDLWVSYRRLERIAITGPISGGGV